MKRTLVIICLIIFTSKSFKAQDSTRILTHEIGFNTVSLIKQLISNSPTNTLSQLPYDLFYNLYYKDLIGLRVGLGLNNSHNETAIVGQIDSRTTDSKSLNLRGGLSYNFVRSKKIVLNGFADFVFSNSSVETANTSTNQVLPNPIETIKTTSSDKTSGIGGQVGVGIKFNIIKHLSIYAEVPIIFMTQKTTSKDTTDEEGVIPETESSFKNTFNRIILPTTIYLVLKF